MALTDEWRKMMEEEIREFIATEMLKNGDALRSVHDSLFSSGLLDSFSMVELLSHLHERYGVDIDPTVVNIELLDTPARVAQLVREASGAPV
jgi:acyl carrier protein